MVALKVIELYVGTCMRLNSETCMHIVYSTIEQESLHCRTLTQQYRHWIRTLILLKGISRVSGTVFSSSDE